jgi:hypothetical protein
MEKTLGISMVVWISAMHFAMAGSSGGYNPVHAAAVSAQSANWAITRLRAEPCSPNCGSSRFAFASLNTQVLDRRTHTNRVLQIPSPITQVDSAYINDRADVAIAIGHMNGDVQAVTIIDLRTGSSKSSFLAYAPSLSPDGRYIGFNKFVPPHGTYGPSTSAVVLVYDVMKSQQANRPPGSQGDPDIEAGLPVYPIENQRAKTYESLARSDFDRHAIIGALSWSGPTLHFVDRVNSIDYAVIVNLAGGAEQPLVSKRLIGPAKSP